jgi:hypothetical protein
MIKVAFLSLSDYVEDYESKFWIILSGQVSVQCPSDFMRNQSLGSSGLGMFWPFPPNGGDSASAHKSQVNPLN